VDAKLLRFMIEWLQFDECTSCQNQIVDAQKRYHCVNCGQLLCVDCSSHHLVLEKLGYFSPVCVCSYCYQFGKTANSSVFQDAAATESRSNQLVTESNYSNKFANLDRADSSTF
jgi:hypothetical protein